MLQFQRRRDAENASLVSMKTVPPPGCIKQSSNGHLPGCAASSSVTESNCYRLQMRRVQSQMHLLREFFRRVFKRQNFLRKIFGLSSPVFTSPMTRTALFGASNIRYLS